MVLVLGAAAAASQLVVPVPRFSSYFKACLTYDDNPFRYSENDLKAFRHGDDPARFPIRSADDLDIAVSAGLKCRYRRLGPGGHAWLRIKLHQYASNWEKSYGWAKLEIVQHLWKGGRLKAGLLWMPGFLIRHFQSHLTEGDEYLACRFAEYLGTVSLSQQVWRFWLTPRYRYEYDDYLPGFEYYDTRAHRPGAVLKFEVARGLELSLDYECKLAQARGPVPDISYRQHKFDLSMKSHPRNLRNLVFGAGYELASREYTTGNSPDIDPSHADRGDWIENIRLEIEYQFKAAKLVFGYRLEWREVSSPYSERIKDVKKYRRNKFSLGVVVNPARS